MFLFSLYSLFFINAFRYCNKSICFTLLLYITFYPLPPFFLKNMHPSSTFWASHILTCRLIEKWNLGSKELYLSDIGAFYGAIIWIAGAGHAFARFFLRFPQNSVHCFTLLNFKIFLCTFRFSLQWGYVPILLLS